MLTGIYSGQFAVPGLSTDYVEQTKEILWGRADLATYSTGLLSGAARDAGNTPTTLLRPGMLLGKITSSGKLIQASPTATDGSQNIVGILPFGLPAQLYGSNEDRLIPYLSTGYVKAKSLLLAANSSYGIAGDTYEYWIRTQLAPQFTLDDSPAGYKQAGRWSRIEYVTADRTVVAADHGTLFVCYGGSANVNFTLPTMVHGLEFGFYNAQDYNMTITATPADSLVTLHDAAADSIAVSTSSEKIGAMFEIIGLGNGKSLAIPHLWKAQTVTVVTA